MRFTAKPKAFTGISLNFSTPDIGQLASSKPELTAYCTSNKCTDNFHARVEIKNVSKQADVCPNCGNYLVWKRKDNRFR